MHIRNMYYFRMDDPGNNFTLTIRKIYSKVTQKNFKEKKTDMNLFEIFFRMSMSNTKIVSKHSN